MLVRKVQYRLRLLFLPRQLFRRVIFLATLVAHGAVWAESERSITGAVFDSVLGMPVQDALVRVDGTSFSARTDAAGIFEIISVPAGSWLVRVTRYGYRPSFPQTVEVVEGFERHVRFDLVPAPIILPPSVVERPPDLATVQEGVRQYNLREIQMAGHRTVAEVLDAIPGVRVYGTSESPGGTRVSVGGASPERVAVLLDGIPLAAGSDGAVDLDVIPLAAVKSIEVSPGARSAGSGDAAIGGAVNLRTNIGILSGHRDLDASGGSFGSYRATLNSGVAFGKHTVEAVFETSGRSNHFTYPDAESTAARQGVKAKAWRGFLSISPGEQGVFHASGFTYNSTVGVPGALEQLQPGATSHNARRRAQCSWDWMRGLRVFAVSAFWFESGEDHLQSAETRIKTDGEWKERFFGARQSLHLTSSIVDGSSEIEVRSRRMEGKDRIPSQSFGVHNQTEFSVRAAAKKTAGFHHGVLSLSLMGAVDGDDRSSPVYSPRAELSGRNHAGFYTRLGWGRSFRRPPLTSLFWKADAFVIGNPNLRPERSSEWDAAVGVRRGSFLVETRYFERQIRDIISWERDAMGRYQPRNVPRAFVIGREDQITVELFRRDLAFAYAHILNGAYDRSGEPNHDGMVLVMSPRHTHDLSANVSIGRLSGRIAGRWVSSRELRRDNTSGKRLPPYKLFDGYARLALRRMRPGIKVGVRIDNITNERVDLLERYPSPGRALTIEALFNL